MPHADSSLVPAEIKTKAEFWTHVYSQLAPLLEGQKNWVSNLSNASSLIYNALLAFPSHFGPDDKAVNWCGFYLNSRFFPRSSDHNPNVSRLLLGPFCGKPACQFINTEPGKARGVVADGFTQAKTLIVPDVHSYPGHIACDRETKSEIVCPLFLGSKPIGILDLDCLALGGFDQDDKEGLEKIAALVANSCEWE